jgi:hypothetical protein
MVSAFQSFGRCFGSAFVTLAVVEEYRWRRKTFHRPIDRPTTGQNKTMPAAPSGRSVALDAIIHRCLAHASVDPGCRIRRLEWVWLDKQ